jgi:hypothetical protein
MDERREISDDERAADSNDAPEQPTDETVGAGEPVGPDNIREGKVRGTMHGGSNASEGQGQGG